MTQALTQQLPAVAHTVAEHFRQAGGRAWLVGGCVRDVLLGLHPKDLDIEVHGLDADRLQHSAAQLGRIELVGKHFGVIKLWADGSEIDLALPRTEIKTGTGHRGFSAHPDPNLGPETATLRRDFTINAMMLDPINGELMDLHHGQADLQQGLLRHVSPAFAEDPLRVLRAMQFAARFQLTLTPETAALCRQLLPEANTLPSSRIWGEWRKLARSPYPSYGLRCLRDSGWLSLYPALQSLIDCPQDPAWHPEGDVWNHTCLSADQAAQLASEHELSAKTREILILAAICHDLGKPPCTFTDEQGRIRSPGHCHAGVAPSRDFLQALHAPGELIRHILPLVQEHLVHLHGGPSARAVRRLATRLMPAHIELWELLVAADASGRAPMPASRPAMPWLELAHELNSAQGKPAPIVNGQLLQSLGHAAGPAMGKTLKQCYEAQMDGAFHDQKSAVSWIQSHLGKADERL